MYLKIVFPPLLQQFLSVWSDCTHMYKSLVFGDEFLAHLKSHQRCSAGIRTWLFWLSLSCPDGQCSHQIQSVSRSDGGSAPRDKTSAENRTPGWSPETDPQWGPRHLDSHRGKVHWNQWSPYNLTLLQLEQTTGSSDQRGTAPPTEPGFYQGVFLHSVTDGVSIPCRCLLSLA